uniref:Uncharacterized protein n=1 Tax=Rhizophora mucronata TaxID=61149 RepID=A0A2P2PLT6_RHIMU
MHVALPFFSQRDYFHNSNL